MDADFVTKRELDLRFEGSDKLRDALRSADKEAVDKANVAATKALDRADEALREYKAGSNEWRAAMTDREQHFLSRVEFLAAHKALEDRVTTIAAQSNDRQGILNERISTIEGRFMAIASIGTAFGVAGVLYAVLS